MSKTSKRASDTVTSDAGGTPALDEDDDAILTPPEGVPATASEAETPAAEPEDEFNPDAPTLSEPHVPTFAEYVEAGYDEGGYHRRFGRNPTPNSERAERERADAALAAMPKGRGGHVGKAKYIVWPHGPLQCNGVTYLPGDTIDLNSTQAESIGECVSLAP